VNKTKEIGTGAIQIDALKLHSDPHGFNNNAPSERKKKVSSRNRGEGTLKASDSQLT